MFCGHGSTSLRLGLKWLMVEWKGNYVGIDEKESFLIHFIYLLDQGNMYVGNSTRDFTNVIINFSGFLIKEWVEKRNLLESLIMFLIIVHQNKQHYKDLFNIYFLTNKPEKSVFSEILRIVFFFYYYFFFSYLKLSQNSHTYLGLLQRIYLAN